jgi:hypothetical protein
MAAAILPGLLQRKTNRTKKPREDELVKIIFYAFSISLATSIAFAGQAPTGKVSYFSGVCPPFFIRDEAGAVINPVGGENIDKPYSPKQTCGLAGCHDYEKITKGYHFQQGKDEKPSEKLASLYQWVSSPGQYGGRW